MCVFLVFEAQHKLQQEMEQQRHFFQGLEQDEAEGRSRDYLAFE